VEGAFRGELIETLRISMFAPSDKIDATMSATLIMNDERSTNLKRRNE